MRYRSLRAAPKLVGVVAALCLLATSCSALEREEAAPRVSMVAETVDGEIIDVGLLLDQDALVWFWAPW